MRHYPIHCPSCHMTTGMKNEAGTRVNIPCATCRELPRYHAKPGWELEPLEPVGRLGYKRPLATTGHLAPWECGRCKQHSGVWGQAESLVFFCRRCHKWLVARGAASSKWVCQGGNERRESVRRRPQEPARGERRLREEWSELLRALPELRLPAEPDLPAAAELYQPLWEGEVYPLVAEAEEADRYSGREGHSSVALRGVCHALANLAATMAGLETLSQAFGEAYAFTKTGWWGGEHGLVAHATMVGTQKWPAADMLKALQRFEANLPSTQERVSRFWGGAVSEETQLVPYVSWNALREQRGRAQSPDASPPTP